MDVKLSFKISKDGRKKYWYLEYGKATGERSAAGVYTWVKPKNEIERSFNKEALAILETKRADMVTFCHISAYFTYLRLKPAQIGSFDLDI